MKSNDLPKDVMAYILTRLSAKSLVRLKCVCRSWCDLIEEPDFIEKHYQTRASITQTNSILVRRSLLPGFDDQDYIMFSLLCKEPSNQFQYFDVDGPFESSTREIYGARGVFLVAYYDEDDDKIRRLYLWNPATREYKSLPTADDPEAPPNARVERWQVALGFDHKSSDYKVVRVWTFRHFRCDSFLSSESYKVAVLSLSAPESWRHIDAVPPSTLISEFDIYFKGKFYWKPQVEPFHDCLISFDFCTEEFRILPLQNPPSAGPILELNDTLALLGSYVLPDKNRVVIWLINEDGGNMSYAKYVTLDIEFTEELEGIESDYLDPLAFFNNNYLLVRNDKGSFALSLSSNQDNQRLDINLEDLQTAIPYNECLVSFQRKVRA